MVNVAATNKIGIDERQALIRTFPCFETLTYSQSKELAALMHEVWYEPNEIIVLAGELVDSISILVEGKAEVTRRVAETKKEEPIAVLNVGEAIGLNDMGFYSLTGIRTATVTALTKLFLLRLDLKDLYDFLGKNNLEISMYAASVRMLLMRFIKQSLPFSKLSSERLKWLTDRVEEVHVAKGTIIFNQGDEGDKCYLIRAGAVEIVSQPNTPEERQLALLKPPTLFGEATLITDTPRNATARAVEETELLVLSHENLSELIESEGNVANMFMTLMVDRSQPLKNPNATVHHRKTADGQQITILKNAENGHYFKLSQEGYFIWQQLDGKHTMQDITLGLAEEFNLFAPDVVAALISKLTKSGFITNLTILDNAELSRKPFWIRAFIKLRKILEIRYAFGDADSWVTRCYQKYIHYLFSKPGQIIIAFLVIAGFITFAISTHSVLTFFNKNHASLWLLLALLPFSLLAVLFHELGHAFAVKAFGREVHYIGIGWYWFSPIAFTDTSDMWLSTRKPRMLVNLAGIYVDFLIAGLSALMILFIVNPYIQGMLWLFALYTYIGGFRMLSPLQEMDGYYVLMDWVEKNRLRQSAVLWLVKKFPRSLREPSLFRENLPEISYWVACIIFLVLVSILTLIVQEFIFIVLGIHANPYISLVLPFLAVIFSSFSIIADIRNQAEE